MNRAGKIRIVAVVCLWVLVLCPVLAQAMPILPSVTVTKSVVADGTSYTSNPAPGPTVLNGSPVTFQFVVKNTGTVPLTGLSLSDSIEGVSSIVGSSINLLEGASITYSLSVNAGIGQQTDTATVTGSYYGTPLSAQDSANYFGAAPAIQVTKYVSVDGGISYQDANDPPFPEATPGGPVIFKYDVTNVGNVDLANVTVTDDVHGAIGALDTLAAGAPAATFFFTSAAAPGANTDTATATGYWNDLPYTASDSATYIGNYEPSFTIIKSVSIDGGATWVSAAPWPQVLVGNPVEYGVVVTNTGPAPLTNIVLQDQLGANAAFDVSTALLSGSIPATLAPGASFAVIFIDPGNPDALASNNAGDLASGSNSGDLSNTTDQATLTASWTDSAGTVSQVTGSAAASYIGARPAISIKKYVLTSSDGNTYATAWDADTPDTAPKLLAGEGVMFRFVLTNTGNAILTSLNLYDLSIDANQQQALSPYNGDLQAALQAAGSLPAPASGGGTAVPLVLEIGPYAAQQGLQTDEGAVSGQCGNFPTNLAMDKANYLTVNPQLALKKQVSTDGQNWSSSVSALQGSTLYFQVVVTNTGDVPLANITVTDPLFPGFSAQIPALAPNAAATLSLGQIAAAQGGGTNTATAATAYTDDAGVQTAVSAAGSASYTVTAVTVSLLVKKQVLVNNCGTWDIYDGDAATNTVPFALVGHEVKFRFTVTNPASSDVAVTVTSLTDSIGGSTGISLPITLAPGASATGDSDPISVTDTFLTMQTDTVTAGAYWTDSSSVQHALPSPTDTAAYLPANPKIQVTKQVSADGGKTWVDTTSVTVGTSVLFRFIVTNIGNVTLTNLSLTDTPFDIGTCALPEVQCPKCGWHYTWRSHCGVDKDEPDVHCGTCGQKCTWNSPHQSGGCGDFDVKCTNSNCGHQDSWRSHDDKNPCSGPQIHCPKCGHNCKWTSPYNTGTFSVPTQLAPGASFSATAGPICTEYGFHEDTATAKGDFVAGSGVGVNCCVTVTSTDKASYTGVISLCTYTKGAYANNGKPGQLLNKYFSTAFRCGLEVGDYNASRCGHGLLWQGNCTGLNDLKSFLLGGGPSGYFTRDYLNPDRTCTAGGDLAKQVAALTINIALGTIQGTGIPGGLGGLHYCHVGDSLNGKTVSNILAIANQALALNKLPAGYDFGALNTLVTNINEGFDECGETSWAMSNLQP